MGADGLLGCLLDPHSSAIATHIVTYTGFCLASLWLKRTGLATGWRMPLYPAAPVLALAFLVAVAAVDMLDPEGRKGLLVSVLTVAAAQILVAGLSRFRRPGA